MNIPRGNRKGIATRAIAAMPPTSSIRLEDFIGFDILTYAPRFPAPGMGHAQQTIASRFGLWIPQSGIGALGKSGKVSDELIIRIAVMNLANFNPTRASRENHDWFDTTAARAAATTVMSSTAHRQGAARIFEGESHALAGRP